MENLLKSAEKALEESKKRRSRGGKRWTPPRGEDIRLTRVKLGLTQPQFAERFGFELSSIQNWEQERSIPEGPTRMLLWMIMTDPDKALELIDRARELEPA